MRVKVNGEEIDLAEGSTIQDAIDAVEAPYIPGCVLGLVKGTKEVERHVNKFKLKTTQGSIIIEILSDAPEVLVETWKDQYKQFLKWVSDDHIPGSGYWSFKNRTDS